MTGDRLYAVCYLLLFTSLFASFFRVESAPSCSLSPDGNGEDSAFRYLTVEHVLSDNYDALDHTLTGTLTALKSRGAHRCWHKHSTFLDHLLSVHHTLRLWGQGEIIGRVGLLHSAYSNSYVNLALFDPNTERGTMKSLVGEEAEKLIHLFCIIDRQEVVVNTLLANREIPEEGLSVPHLRNPEEKVFLDSETLRMLAVFTMADIGDQYFGWQDQLFGGGGMEGSMIVPGLDFPERHNTQALWPGISKPGLWMSYLSQLGAVVRTFKGEKVMIPPVFANCTRTLSVDAESKSRDLYWSVITGDVNEDEEAIETLRQAIHQNPWAFEPLVILAQKQLHLGDFNGAKESAQKALDIEHEWGVPWDKRLSFGAWVAWTRVLLLRAMDEEPWPTNSWDINNMGLVH